jgi:hypothetical protein
MIKTAIRKIGAVFLSCTWYESMNCLLCYLRTEKPIIIGSQRASEYYLQIKQFNTDPETITFIIVLQN